MTTPVTTSPVDSAGIALAQTAYTAYGDSITGGAGASSLAAAYASLLGVDAGATLRNVARSGQLVCNIATMEAFSADRPRGRADGASYVTLLEGTNDAYSTDGGAGAQANFNACQIATLTWLAIPYASKATAQSAACVKTGSWSQNYYEGDELNSSTGGDSMDCSLATSGGPIMFWYLAGDKLTGSFTYAVDGGAPTAVQTASIATMVNANGTEATGVYSVRIAAPAAGTHHVKFTVTSTAGGNGLVDLWGIGTPPAAGAEAAPRVYLGGVPFQRADGHSAITATFDAAAQSNVARAQADGLPVSFVDVRKFLLGTEAEMRDPLHPNDLGHSEIRRAFEAAITGH